MQQPRKKLGTNLGIAPAFELLAPVRTTTPTEPNGDEQTSARGDDREADAHASEGSSNPGDIAANVAASVAAPPSPIPATVRAAPPKVPRASTKPAAAVAPPPPIPALAKRIHGTFSEPYQRRTGDRALTRQTTLTVAIDLDDRFETFFRRHRGQHKTRSALWAAAMEFYLLNHE